MLLVLFWFVAAAIIFIWISTIAGPIPAAIVTAGLLLLVFYGMGAR
jgi:hypothetical protein